MIYVKDKYSKTPPSVEALYEMREYVLHEKLKAHSIEGLTRAERAELFDLLRMLGIRAHVAVPDEIITRGWVINFREWLNEYLIEFDIGGDLRVFAIDEQSILDHNWNMYKVVGIKQGSSRQTKEANGRTIDMDSSR